MAGELAMSAEAEIRGESSLAIKFQDFYLTLCSADSDFCGVGPNRAHHKGHAVAPWRPVGCLRAVGGRAGLGGGHACSAVVSSAMLGTETLCMGLMKSHGCWNLLN